MADRPPKILQHDHKRFGPFTVEVIQSVNDWQRGGDAKQKRRRGLALKTACAGLPVEYRQATSRCFRQIALLKGGMWDLLAEDELKETISAWTMDLEVAKSFKGGVPPEGADYRGTIFERNPRDAVVIVNLDAVYRDPRFINAVNGYRNYIAGIADGIDAYGRTQSEVILEVDSLSKAEIYSFGGHSSNFDDLVKITARAMYGREPSADELKDFFLRAESARSAAGPAWLDREQTDRVLKNMGPHIDLLSLIKSWQTCV